MLSSGLLCHVALVRTTKFTVHSISSQHSMLQLFVTAKVVPTPPIPLTLMMEVIRSSETSILTTATWCNFPEDSILYNSNCMKTTDQLPELL
jgi:hypothetical protein